VFFHFDLIALFIEDAHLPFEHDEGMIFIEMGVNLVFPAFIVNLGMDPHILGLGDELGDPSLLHVRRAQRKFLGLGFFGWR
jgi:hypothetical protein